MPEKKDTRPTEEAKTLRVSAEGVSQRGGSYSNLILINHTAEEFILDFLMQFGNEAQLVSRVIISPSHAMRLADTLRTSIERHSQQHKAPSASIEKAAQQRKRPRFSKRPKSKSKRRTRGNGGAA